MTESTLFQEKRPSTPEISEREAKEQLQKLEWDMVRFADLLKMADRRFQLPQECYVVDIACGLAEPGPGTAYWLRKTDRQGKYFGCDIVGDPEELGSAQALDQAVPFARPDFASLWSKVRENIETGYGPSFDATTSDIWSYIEASTPEPSLLMIRHPQVRSDAEEGTHIFDDIFANMVNYATEKNIPIMITTSNLESLGLIIEGLRKAFHQASFTDAEETPANDYTLTTGVDGVYSNPDGQRWQLETADTFKLKRLEPASQRKLDMITLFLRPELG